MTHHGFSDEQWRLLHSALRDALAYVAQVEDGFIGTLREYSKVSHFLSKTEHASTSAFIRDFAHEATISMNQHFAGGDDQVAAQIDAEVCSAYALVRAKLPDEAPAFKELLLDAARVTAEAHRGISRREAEAITVLERALA